MEPPHVRQERPRAARADQLVPPGALHQRVAQRRDRGDHRQDRQRPAAAGAGRADQGGQVDARHLQGGEPGGGRAPDGRLPLLCGPAADQLHAAVRPRGPVHRHEDAHRAPPYRHDAIHES